ncbi:MAG: hypothetical protein EKK48_12055 [Candidatus Melainabacteria bacterium]|nr:MAG: hypothetical protein EKK48_12055 [Candidatus Melainabacteria bacterium]
MAKKTEIEQHKEAAINEVRCHQQQILSLYPNKSKLQKIAQEGCRQIIRAIELIPSGEGEEE